MHAPGLAITYEAGVLDLATRSLSYEVASVCIHAICVFAVASGFCRPMGRRRMPTSLATAAQFGPGACEVQLLIYRRNKTYLVHSLILYAGLGGGLYSRAPWRPVPGESGAIVKWNMRAACFVLCDSSNRVSSMCRILSVPRAEFVNLSECMPRQSWGVERVRQTCLRQFRFGFLVKQFYSF